MRARAAGAAEGILELDVLQAGPPEFDAHGFQQLIGDVRALDLHDHVPAPLLRSPHHTGGDYAGSSGKVMMRGPEHVSIITRLAFGDRKAL